MMDDEDNWQPIATAPKDQRIMLWVRYGPTFGQWDDDKYNRRPQPFWSYDGVRRPTDMRANPPTHWQPLPSPPLKTADRSPEPSPNPHGSAMTDDDKETDEAVARLAAAFSECPGNGWHRWNRNTGECDHCKAPYPYPDEAP